MKYKFCYEDPDHNSHIRYYNALNVSTAHEMFKASVIHSIKREVKLHGIYRLEPNGWVRVEKK